jgi:hypothetical protein
MLIRLSAYASLILGIGSALAVFAQLGGGTGLGLGAFALICGFVALTERPKGRVRRAALIGLTTGAIGVIGFLAWVLVASQGT